MKNAKVRKKEGYAVVTVTTPLGRERLVFNQIVDGDQLIYDTSEEVAKAQIVAVVGEVIRDYGLTMPNHFVLGTIAKNIYGYYKVFRFKDIRLAFDAAMVGRLGFEFNDYGKPLAWPLVQRVVRGYRVAHKGYFAKVIQDVMEIDNASSLPAIAAEKSGGVGEVSLKLGRLAIMKKGWQ